MIAFVVVVVVVVAAAAVGAVGAAADMTGECQWIAIQGSCNKCAEATGGRQIWGHIGDQWDADVPGSGDDGRKGDIQQRMELKQTRK